MVECQGCLVKCHTKEEATDDCFTLSFEQMAGMFKDPGEDILERLWGLEGKNKEDQLNEIEKLLRK